MLNLFKKNSVVKLIVDSVITGISIDQQIYNDIYSAQDAILLEVNSILSRASKYNEEEYMRLKNLISLGFGNALDIKDFKKMQDELSDKNLLKKMIEYYNQTYPLNKFIDKECVQKICSKYNLLLARSDDYIAEIPEKNQNEIISFRIKRNDIRKPYEVGTRFLSLSLPFYNILQDQKEREDFFNEMLPGTDLLIIAPEYKLNTLGKIKEGHILKMNDPIVLQPVLEGYLIVSSWGLEASDELIVNPINN